MEISKGGFQSLQQNMEECLSCFRNCFSAKGTGNLVRVNGIMEKENYCEIFDVNLKVPARNMKHDWSFIHDSDLKHISKLAKKCIQKKKINVLC